MANNHTNVHATDTNGRQVSIAHTSTDSPILPAGNLQQLQQIDPGLVSWVVRQTEIEAEHRRKSENRINAYVFIERISGVAAGLLVSLFGFAVGGYLVLQGHDWAGVGICGTTLATIVTVLVTKGIGRKQVEPQQRKPKVKTTRPTKPTKK